MKGQREVEVSEEAYEALEELLHAKPVLFKDMQPRMRERCERIVNTLAPVLCAQERERAEAKRLEARKTYQCPECGRQAKDGKPLHRQGCSRPDAVLFTVPVSSQLPPGLPLFHCAIHGLIQPERWDHGCVGEPTHCPVPTSAGRCLEQLKEMHVPFPDQAAQQERERVKEALLSDEAVDLVKVEYRVVGEFCHGETYHGRVVPGLSVAHAVIRGLESGGGRGQIQQRTVTRTPWEDVADV